MSAVSWSSDIVSMMTFTDGWCSASHRLTSRPDASPSLTSSNTRSGAVDSDERLDLVGRFGLADELDSLHLADRDRQTHPEHRVVVDDRNTQRRHGNAAGSWTWTWVPRGVLGRNRTAPPSSLARSRIAVSPTPSDT